MSEQYHSWSQLLLAQFASGKLRHNIHHCGASLVLVQTATPLLPRPPMRTKQAIARCRRDLVDTLQDHLIQT